MTTCKDPKELRSSQAPQVYVRVSQHPAGEAADLAASGPMNPGGASGSHLHGMTITPKLLASLGSEASLWWLGACTVVGCSSQGSGSSSGDLASSAGLGEVVASSSMTSNMEALKRSSFSKRGTRHLQRSWMVPQSIPGGVPDCMVHCWRARASATV